jgi:hypothetical protein
LREAGSFHGRAETQHGKGSDEHENENSSHEQVSLSEKEPNKVFCQMSLLHCYYRLGITGSPPLRGDT